MWNYGQHPLHIALIKKKPQIKLKGHKTGHMIDDSSFF